MTPTSCMPESLGEAVDRMTAAGYTDSFRAEADGLHAAAAGTVHDPEKMLIEAFTRFEGPSNPDDEAIVFALRCEVTGVRGTFTVAYGPGATAIEGEAARKLKTRARG